MDYYNSIIKFCHSKNLRVYCKAHPECRASFDEFNFDKVIKKNIHVRGSNVLIMGFTFKENCPDLRNTGVIDLVIGFKSLNCNVDVYDPWVDKEEALQEFGFKPVNKPIDSKYDAILLAVAHNKFKKLSVEQIKSFGKDNHVLYDVKYLLKADEVDGRL